MFLFPGGRSRIKPVFNRMMLPKPAQVTAAAYTLAMGDAWGAVPLNSASAQTVTIPKHSSVPLPLRTRIKLLRLGAGLPTVAAASGVTFNKPTGIRPNVYMGCRAKKNGDQTTANYSTVAAVAWDGTDEHDTHAFHDPLSDNTKAIIKAGYGIKKVSAEFNILATLVGVGSDDQMSIRLNGGATIGTTIAEHDSNPFGQIQEYVSSLSIIVTDNDYIEGWLFCSDTSITVGAATSSLALRVEEINPVGNIAYRYGEVELYQYDIDQWSISGDALG